MKAKIAVIGAGVLMISAGLGVMHAQAATIAVPAPAGVASAVAVKVGQLASVGETGATASKSGSGAAAKPIAIGETPLLTGTKLTVKSASDSLVDTGETSLGRVQVAPWSTDVKPGQASSSAALATAKLNGVGSVAVAPSSSFASWTPGKSTSRSISDGAVLTLGDYTIKILHAESGSSASGKTYLVQLMGKDLGATNSKGCVLDVGPLATVGCLSAINGIGADADIVKAIIGQSGPVAKVVSATASGGSGVIATGGGTSVLSQETSRASATSGFARTGVNALMIFALGLTLAVAGAVALYGDRQMQLLPVKAQ